MLQAGERLTNALVETGVVIAGMSKEIEAHFILTADESTKTDYN